MRKRPDGKLFEALEAFAAASDERSLSKAARILGCSTPTVASMITRLESDIGVRLLRRTARGVSLTPEGEALLPKARSVVRLASEFERDAVSEGREAIREVPIGAVEACLFQFLPDFMRYLDQALPGVRLRVTLYDTADLVATLLAGEISIAFGRFAELSVRGISLQLLSEEPSVLIVPRDHRLSRRKNVTWEDVRDEEWIMTLPRVNPGYAAAFVRACRTEGFEPRVRHRPETIQHQIAYVACREGIALIPESYLSSIPAAVQAVPFEGPLPSIRMSAAVSRLRTDPLRDQVLQEAIRFASEKTSFRQ